MTGRGFTLHEMLISLTMTGFVIALAASAASGQLRFYRGLGQVSETRTQVAQAAAIAANVLRDVLSPGDVLAASDSAIEVAATIGLAHTCTTEAGRLVLAGAQPRGNTPASYVEPPHPGDVAHVLVADSAGHGWIALSVLSVAALDEPCAQLPEQRAVWEVRASAALHVPAGSPVHFTRRTRLSLYRASDDRWYLGLRDWNAATGRFNSIQPVAGPLLPYSSIASQTGLRFELLDTHGRAAGAPGGEVALVRVLARGESLRPVKMPGLATTEGGFARDSAVASIFIAR